MTGSVSVLDAKYLVGITEVNFSYSSYITHTLIVLFERNFDKRGDLGYEDSKIIEID